MKENTHHRRLLLWFSLLLLAGGMLTLWNQRGYLQTAYLSGWIPFSCPTYAAPGPDGRLAVVDSTQRRVLALNADGQLEFMVTGGSRDSGRFFNAFKAIPGPGDSVLVLNSVPDQRGVYHRREEILQISPDGTGKVLYRLLHNPTLPDHTLLRHGRLRSLTWDGEILRWFECLPEGLAARMMPLPGSHAVTEAVFPVPDANWHVAFAARENADSAVYTHKNGGIYRIAAAFDAQPELLYEPGAAAPPTRKPWEVVCDGDGNILFADMIGRTVRKLSGDTAVELVQWPGGVKAPELYRLGAAGKRFVGCTESGIFESSVDRLRAEPTIVDGAPLSPALQWRLAFAALALAALLLGAAGSAWYASKLEYDWKVPPVAWLFVGLVVVMGVAAYVAGSGLIRDFSRRNDQQTLRHLTQLIRSTAAALDGDRIGRLNHPSDYMNEDYRALRRELDLLFPVDAENSDGFYYVINRVIDGQLYGMIWQESSIGLFHPFNFFDPEFPDSSFRDAQAGLIRTANVEDVTGSWLFGVGPILDSAGNVAGLLEIGTDNYVFAARNQRLIQSTILDIVTVLIVVALVLLEAVYFFELKRKTKQNQPYDTADTTPVFFTRPFIFLYFSASSMPLAFVPLMMKDFYAPVPFLSEGLVLALPISVNMLAFGIGNWIAGNHTRRGTTRKIIYWGLWLSAAGFAASALATGMTGFVLARGLVGLGNGFAFIGIRSILLLDDRKRFKDTGYAHFYAGMTAGINVGLILGALIADAWSYRTAFWISTLLLAGAIGFEMKFMRRIVAGFAEGTEAPRERCKGVFRRFITDPHALAFIFLDIIPAYTIAAFMFYFFPLFAESNGMGTADIGRWMLFAGVLTILFGPTLTRSISQGLGTRRGMYFALTVWSASILVFAVTGSLEGAILTLLAMGLADGFAAPFCNNYFLTLNASQRAGEERAVSYFELAGKAGDTLGPVIFAFALGFGQTRGVAAISMACLLFVVLLYGVDRWYHRKGPGL